MAADRSGTILLETLRFDAANRHSYLFQDPVRILTTETLDEIPRLFARIEEAIAEGLYVAGYFAYECGYYFERRGEASLAPQPMPLAWFGVYEQPAVFDHAEGRFLQPHSLPDSDRQIYASTKPLSDHVALGIPKPEYLASLLKIKDYIAAGETYQVNFTDGISLRTEESAGALFASLSRHHSAAYGAMMNIAGDHILSFSPELFFQRDGSSIETRPMKGTMRRGLDAAEDAAAARRLQNDAKNRSEHVMIVDLLRNDLGRICTMGSVRTENLFSIERYETLLQMVSTVAGTLRPGVTYYEIFRSLFPSGSVTGAPKIRTMQIIRELEKQPRGVYTGAIGFISPNSTARFNVAIRTLVLKDGLARMGVGGGIVAESDPEDEHRECLLKAAFLTRTRHDFQLIETMLWDKEFDRLPLHMDRLGSSALYFDFAFDSEAVLARLQALADSFAAGERRRVRLLLNHDGEITLESVALHGGPSLELVKLSTERTDPGDVYLRHKTTHRALYDRQFAEARAEGFDEVIFANERGEITEGAISNIFIEKDGRLLTPPPRCGLLAGVYRRHLLETRANAEERVLTIDDLTCADAIYLCNSVRGMHKVRSLCLGETEAPHLASEQVCG
ncbi:MAG TPA: aminodeoxychorismate synthase component I [Acidobacteriaceae bacterium]|nr:aminodeoxychorismate synthase component I [Acidobacteriaceae bacterium]